MVMDKISDFFKEFKYRITNPLFFSFITSWLLINWRIPIGILGYKSSELKVDGYVSYIDLISKNASAWRYFILPLMYALGYTFMFPILRMYIGAFLSYFKKRSDNWNTKIMKDYYVPMKRFLKQKEQTDDLYAELHKIFLEDSATFEENVKLKADIFSLQNKISDGELELRKLQNEKIDTAMSLIKLDEKISLYERNINPLINGLWNITITFEGQPDNTYLIKIEEGTLLLKDEVWGNIIMINCDYNKFVLSITVSLKDIKNLILSGSSDFFLTVIKLSIKYASDDFRIVNMEGQDTYGTSYKFNLVSY